MQRDSSGNKAALTRSNKAGIFPEENKKILESEIYDLGFDEEEIFEKDRDKQSPIIHKPKTGCDKECISL